MCPRARHPVCRSSPPMYVCVCHTITDREIREAIDRGARSFCEVQSSLPVGGCCGRCEQVAREVVDEHLSAMLAVARSQSLADDGACHR
ncbi:MAG: (2Fe-2S)-binding protein [Steroidobacteraceae bacterium]